MAVCVKPYMTVTEMRVFVCADVVPILLRLIFHRNFTPGPFKLGAAQVVVNVVAIVWLLFNVVSQCTLYFVYFRTINSCWHGGVVNM